MTDVRMAIIGAGRIGLTHAETIAHRTHGGRVGAVGVAATRSIRDGRPVNVKVGGPEAMAEKGRLPSSDGGPQRRNKMV